ncbi:nucleotide exchange factor GrpE [Haloferula sp. A504]|uniref:nucleotide exchange factor GrpE n=1 Tax=Haloferula sp. A504 TaxID=3373601 RepID=UPI0031CC1D64|nr:nucleotide exchange factor GrpE [Verrucomicrobiaceae bacterium E54]
MNSKESEAEVRPDEAPEESVEQVEQKSPAETEAAEAGEPGEAPENDDEPVDPLEALEKDLLKWKEVAMRTAADLENFRKRAARDREESLRYANQSLLEELLPILDNFDMGMQAAGQEQGSMIYVGMEMVRKQLDEFMRNQGVTEVAAEGLDFDPNLHDAVSQEEGEEEGKVLRVTRRGYLLRDRLLRPASVVVSKKSEPEDA